MLGPGDNTGVLREEYHHRPSGQGGSNDAQHRQPYQGSRDADGPLPRSHLPARRHAKAADVRRSLLLLARPSRPPDSVAGVVSAAARSLCHRREDVCHRPCGATDFIPTGPRQRRDRRDVSREVHGARRRRDHWRRARESARVQGPQTVWAARRRDVRLHPTIGRRQSLLLLRPRRRMGAGIHQDRDLRHPDALQATCDALGPRDIQTFFDRWSHRLPWPLRPEDRAAGFDHRVTLCQLEISRTQIFDRPVQGRHFFEAVIRENLDLGRPSRVRLLFPRRITRATPPPAYGYHTRIITDGVNPSLHIEYKHSHLKQYFKEGRGLRSELTINNPTDFGFRKALDQLPALHALGDEVNRTLLTVERVSHACILTTTAWDRLQRPFQHAGQRVPALRFGDPRVLALLQALSGFAHLLAGFRHRDLRPRVAALPGPSYPPSQMTSDLRRLRRHGLIDRVSGTHRYQLTPYGVRVAFFYSKLHLRIFRPHAPALERFCDALPRPLRAALDQLDAAIDRIYREAGLAA